MKSEPRALGRTRLHPALTRAASPELAEYVISKIGLLHGNAIRQRVNHQTEAKTGANTLENVTSRHGQPIRLRPAPGRGYRGARKYEHEMIRQSIALALQDLHCQCESTGPTLLLWHTELAPMDLLPLITDTVAWAESPDSQLPALLDRLEALSVREAPLPPQTVRAVRLSRKAADRRDLCAVSRHHAMSCWIGWPNMV